MLVHFPRITTDGLVLCLDAGNQLSYPGSGSTWTDLSGNGNDGTLVNSVSYDNKSLLFGGSYARLPAASNSINTIYTNNEFTYSLWFKYNTHVYQGIGGIARNDNDSTICFGYRIQGDSDIVFFDGRFGGIRRVITVIQPVDIETYFNKFINITSTYDGNIFKVYLNGSLVTTSNFASQIDDFREKAVVLGVDSGYGYFNGNIAQCLLYNIQLDQDKVIQNYNATKGRYGL